MATRRFRVYLAGPISGCNHAQIHDWREEVKTKYGHEMEFIDPTERRQRRSYQIVESDIAAIEQADGMLVNMWRESIGSAIGMVHAHRAGRPAVVADPNRINNQTLHFYAAAVEDAPLKAANTLLRILRAETGWTVIKSDSRGEEPFSRRKLTSALRAACRRTRRDGIVVPVLVVSQVIESLHANGRNHQRRVTSTKISDAVVARLRELEADPIYADAVKGMVKSWAERRERPAPPAPSGRTQVEIASGKSHGTIWGKGINDLKNLPPLARRAFKAIARVRGITRIHFGRFSRQGQRKSLGVAVVDSKQAHILEGKIYDNGEKGNMQTFQVRVQVADDKPRVLAAIKAALREEKLWAG